MCSGVCTNMQIMDLVKGEQTMAKVKLEATTIRMKDNTVIVYRTENGEDLRNTLDILIKRGVAYVRQKLEDNEWHTMLVCSMNEITRIENTWSKVNEAEAIEGWNEVSTRNKASQEIIKELKTNMATLQRLGCSGAFFRWVPFSGKRCM